MLVAIDICNTLCDVNQMLWEVLGQPPDTSQYQHPGVTTDFFQKNLWIFAQAKAFDGSAEKICLLGQKHQLIYLTARPQIARKVTKNWLKKNGFPLAPLIMTNQKAMIAQKLGVQLAIDDAPHEIISLQSVTSVLIHAQTYNVGMGKRFTWKENFLPLLEKIESQQKKSCFF